MPLILVENGAHKGKSFALSPPGPFSIGRDHTTEICLPDPMMSRRHCLIEVKSGVYTLRDLGSANGTQLNGERVDERPLKLGDRIIAGDTLLTFLGEDSTDPLVGKKLKGYEILERIGRGGMGTVYRARQISLDRLVALKVLSPEMVEDPSFVARFLEEARSAARLSHPHVVMVYDIDDEVVEGQRVVYYSMEYMSGGSVEDLLNREGGRLDPEKALGIVLETAQGLSYAEQVGLVHRDIKPGNLMIHESGIIKIGDLGIATRSAGKGILASQKGGISGSPHYISPEQARGQDLDSRADIYSLGASLFQMLAGRPPFDGADLKELLLKQVREPPPALEEIRPDLPAGIPPMVAKMLEKDRDQRFAGARALIEATEGCLDEVRFAGGPARRPMAALRLVILGLLSFAVILALVTGGAFAWIKLRQLRVERERSEKKFQDEVEDARTALEMGRIEDAEKLLAELDREPILAAGFPQIAAEVESLRESVSSTREKRARRQKEEDAGADLAGVREKMPRDLAAVRTVKELEEMIPPLEKVGHDHAGTEAARSARDEVSRIRSAIRDLERRLERSADALRSLLITAGTFLDSNPPRYREALAKLRSPPTEIRATPQEKELADRVAAITAQMDQAAERWAAEAEGTASKGDAAGALRTLEWLRDRVEGKALERLDEAMKKIGGRP